jgi:predicted Zn-dependent protease
MGSLAKDHRPDPPLAAVRELRARGRLAEAQAKLDALLVARPTDPLVEAERIFLMVERRDPEARAAADRAVASYPSSYGCWVALAESALRAAPSDADVAAAAAERALALWPKGALAYLLLAYAERARDRPAEALAAVRRGLGAVTLDYRLRTLEGDLLRQLGRTEDAARAADALPEGPWKARQRLEGGLAGLSPEEAEAELTTLAALEPLRPEVHERLGTRLYQTRKFGKAAQAFEKALALSPDSAYLRRMAGFACSKAGDAGRAAALLRPLFLDDPLEERVRTTFIAACRRTGDTAALGAAIDEALARHPHARMLHGIRKRYAPAIPAPAELPASAEAGSGGGSETP